MRKIFISLVLAVGFVAVISSCGETATNEKAEEVIKGYDWRYDSDHYNVDFKGSITELLYRNRDLIRDFEIKKGSMDDVFLNLTGKEFAR